MRIRRPDGSGSLLAVWTAMQQRSRAVPQVHALVAVKHLDGAKSRLALDFGIDDRARLTLAMLADTLTAIANSPAIASLTVVTPDPRVAETARRFGADLVPDPPASMTAADERLNAALSPRREPIAGAHPGGGHRGVAGRPSRIAVAGGHRHARRGPGRTSRRGDRSPRRGHVGTGVTRRRISSCGRGSGPSRPVVTSTAAPSPSAGTGPVCDWMPIRRATLPTRWTSASVRTPARSWPTSAGSHAGTVRADSVGRA